MVRRLAAAGAGLATEEDVREAVHACNRQVYASARAAGDALATMGTTVAGAVLLPGSLLAFNVGDSRVFAAPPRRGAPAQRGRQSAAAARAAHHVRRDPVPRRHAGLPRRRTPCDGRVLAVGDRYLICTDGLTDPLPNDVLDGVLREYDGGRAAFELWKAAIAAGGPDNITLAVVRVADR